MIKKGKFDWYSPDKGMSPEAGSLFNRVPGMKELPHIPTYVMELQTLMQDTNVTSKQLALVVKKEPMIAGNLLSIANNLKAASGTKIESVEHAITYVGFKTLSDVILTASVSSFKFQCKLFKSDNFWRESFLTGMVAEFLARRYNPGLVPDEVYLAGTLANVGKVVQAICLPAETDIIATEIENPKNPKSWVAAEIDHKTYDHGILGEIAAGFWGLPAYVVEVAGTHHIPESTTPKGAPADLTEIVRLANQLSHWLLFQPSRMQKAVYDRSLERFGLTEASIEKMVDELMGLKASAEAMTLAS